MSGEAGHSPMHQFEINSLIPIKVAGVDISFTNSSLFMVIAMLSLTIFMMGIGRKAMVPGRWQSMVELSYEFVANLLKDIVGTEGRKFFPLVFSLFMFILFCNLLGMLPYSFTVTSHIIVTFALAAFIFLGVTIVGIFRHGKHFFSYFLPEGTPLWLAPLMVVIEVFSYFMRPVTLSIRLAANMMAGHLLLKVLAGFVIAMGLFGVLPMAFIVLMIAFEFFIAILQAFVFTVLTCVYLHDAIHLH